MNSEEILNMKMLIGDLDLTTDTKNKLYNQTTKIEDKLNKQKEVLDKIKEILKDYGDKEDISEITMYYISGESLIHILKLLEEIE